MTAPRRATSAKFIWLTLLISSTAILAWLWIASHTSTPKRLYHSTDRFCSWVGFESGQFIYWYDGGADVHTFKPRDFKFLGVFCKAYAIGNWHYFSTGIHGGYACGWLAALWTPTIWFMVARPRLRRKRGWCLKCGYDLAGVRDPVCPECGQLSETAPSPRTS